MPTAPAREIVGWAEAVERHGYTIPSACSVPAVGSVATCTWTLAPWRCGDKMERIRLGPRVITPVTRHPAVAASRRRRSPSWRRGARWSASAPRQRRVQHLVRGRGAARHRAARVRADDPESHDDGPRRVPRDAPPRFTWSRVRVPHLPRRVRPEDAAARRPNGRRRRDSHRLTPEIGVAPIAQVHAGAREAGPRPRRARPPLAARRQRGVRATPRRWRKSAAAGSAMAGNPPTDRPPRARTAPPTSAEQAARAGDAGRALRVRAACAPGEAAPTAADPPSSVLSNASSPSVAIVVPADCVRSSSARSKRGHASSGLASISTTIPCSATSLSR